LLSLLVTGAREWAQSGIGFDLLFFHLRLRSLIIVELKLGKFTHADAGQMNLIRRPLNNLLPMGLPRFSTRNCPRTLPPDCTAWGQDRRKGSVLAKGLVPYASATAALCSEMEFAAELATNPLYLGPVRANFNKIAGKVNEVFNSSQPLYTRITLTIALWRYRRQGRSTRRNGTNPEMSFAEMLALEPAYEIAPRTKAEQIACKVNDEYHHNRPVRMQ